MWYLKCLGKAYALLSQLLTGQRSKLYDLDLMLSSIKVILAAGLNIHQHSPALDGT